MSSSSPPLGAEYFYKAKKLASEHKYLLAKRLFKHCIKIRPDAASPHYHLGNVLIELNCLEEAVSHFKKASKKKPEIVKYQQFYKHYAILFQCKYNNSSLVTPGGPIQINHQNENNNHHNHDNEEKFNCISYENEEENYSNDSNDDNDSNDNDSNDSKEADQYYLSHKTYINKFSVHKLLNEFCPSPFYVKANATTNEVLRTLAKAIHFFDPNNNEDIEYRNKMYREFRYKQQMKKMPKLNKKHLFHLLKHQKKVLTERLKKKNKKKHWKNSKKLAFCPFCYVPNDVECIHYEQKKKNGPRIFKHRYAYSFED